MVFVPCFTPSAEYVYHILAVPTSQLGGPGPVSISQWSTQLVGMVFLSGQLSEKHGFFHGAYPAKLFLGYVGVDSHILYIIYGNPVISTERSLQKGLYDVDGGCSVSIVVVVFLQSKSLRLYPLVNCYITMENRKVSFYWWLENHQCPNKMIPSTILIHMKNHSWWLPGLVNVYKTMERSTMLLTGKSTISMAIFKSYVKLPEGRKWRFTAGKICKPSKRTRRPKCAICCRATWIAWRLPDSAGWCPRKRISGFLNPYEL